MAGGFIGRNKKEGIANSVRDKAINFGSLFSALVTSAKSALLGVRLGFKKLRFAPKPLGKIAK